MSVGYFTNIDTPGAFGIGVGKVCYLQDRADFVVKNPQYQFVDRIYELQAIWWAPAHNGTDQPDVYFV